MPDSNFAERLMHGRGVFLGEGRLIRLLKVVELHLLGLFSRIPLPNSIDRDSVDDCIQPRPQQTRILQLVNAAESLDPCVLKHIEPVVS